MNFWFIASETVLEYPSIELIQPKQHLNFLLLDYLLSPAFGPKTF